jgi:fatty-acyl-CoA synthase
MSEFESRCEGELVVRSAGVCRGTTRFPEPSDDPAWVGPRARRTGDWASFDRDGRLVIRGRIDDAVHTSGRVFFPVDVQQALCAHPDVRYAVAVPTRSSAEVPIAFSAAVKLRSGSRTTAHDLSVHLHSINPNLPIAHVHVTAHIPVTEQGKPNRAALDAEFSLLDGLAAMIESSAAHAE